MKAHACLFRIATFVTAVMVAVPAGASGKVATTRDVTPRFDSAQRVFRLDAAGVTYAMGVDPDGVLQTLYWGARLPDTDTLGPATPAVERSSFDPKGALTPQEYAGWGGAMTAT
ncbi:MAG: hypothetical protein ABWZ85_13650, partial [Luteibacter sp.]